MLQIKTIFLTCPNAANYDAFKTTSGNFQSILTSLKILI